MRVHGPGIQIPSSVRSFAALSEKKSGRQPTHQIETMIFPESLTQPRHKCKKKIPFLQGDDLNKKWSGRWDSNPRRPAWEADILPLNYARIRKTSGGNLKQRVAFVKCFLGFILFRHQIKADIEAAAVMKQCLKIKGLGSVLPLCFPGQLFRAAASACTPSRPVAQWDGFTPGINGEHLIRAVVLEGGLVAQGGESVSSYCP